VVRDARTVDLVDLSSLHAGPHKRCVSSPAASAELIAQLEKAISDLSTEISLMQPNMHAAERYEGVTDKLKECNENLDQVRDSSKVVAARFEEVRNTRQRLFMECYNHISESLTIIYKDLTKSSKHPLGGNAYLTLENTDEPYLGGVRYTAMPPMKRYRDMDQLSGGEKTVAALALLFSIHSFRQAPFFVLDEVDAALDNVNVQKVCHYIRQRSKNFQCIVISLKDMFFEHADILFGVCKDVPTVSSRVLSLNLREYPTSNVDVQGTAEYKQSVVASLDKAISKAMTAVAAPVTTTKEGGEDEDDTVVKPKGKKARGSGGSRTGLRA
jgi:chromosome segregation ATPase